MIKGGGMLFVLMLVVSLVLTPATVFAADVDGYAGLSNCQWDPVKWEDNENSWNLYIKNWGRTPITAMSRLAGLCGPDGICSEQWGLGCKADRVGCNIGGCAACRSEEQGMLAACDDPLSCDISQCDLACPATAVASDQCVSCPADPTYGLAHCCCCWGVSLAFANKSWGSWSGTPTGLPRYFDTHMNHRGTSECYGGNTGGDWGSSGCAHTECCVQTWCLTGNMVPSPQTSTE